MTDQQSSSFPKRSDPRSTDELIELALTTGMDADHPGWDAIWLLRYRDTPEVFEKAKSLCSSTDPQARRVGVDILAQLGIPERTFRAETFELFSQMFSQENSPDVLESIIVGFSHLGDLRAIDILLSMKNHADKDIRFAVAFSLNSYEDARTISALIELSEDIDQDVRDWATFGLGSIFASDTPEIREALYKRLTDYDLTTQGEALVGLARRKDERLVARIIQELGNEPLIDFAIEAASEFADPRFYEALLAVKERTDFNNYGLDAALENCNHDT